MCRAHPLFLAIFLILLKVIEFPWSCNGSPWAAPCCTQGSCQSPVEVPSAFEGSLHFGYSWTLAHQAHLGSSSFQRSGTYPPHQSRDGFAKDAGVEVRGLQTYGEGQRPLLSCLWAILARLHGQHISGSSATCYSYAPYELSWTRTSRRFLELEPTPTFAEPQAKTASQISTSSGKRWWTAAAQREGQSPAQEPWKGSSQRHWQGLESTSAWARGDGAIAPTAAASTGKLFGSHVDAAANSFSHEIGRASCRERV